ncbi:hypothetical protein JXL19_00835 [bacterium]|nr:hypothetical protein [bacterium]
MKIYPYIEVCPYQHLNIFASWEEAATYFSHRFRTFKIKQKEILRGYLAGIFQENGFLLVRSHGTCLKIGLQTTSTFA